ncbi:MAG: IS66 family insertion sequence element accessory protein TnpB [Sandaracinaceae bacterium]
MIPSTTRIYVCVEPQDMRRSFDGLALAAQSHLGEDPQSGALFVFVNKRCNRLKVLWFDRNGYCLLYKRLHHARFVLPEERTIDAKMLALILRGVETSRARSLRR